MKLPVFIIIGGLLAAPIMPAQKPAKAATVSANNPPASSNQELNIEAYVELLRQDVNKEKSQIIGQVMDFDADQAAAFWPVYKDFQTEYAMIGDQIQKLVLDYAAHYDNMTDEVADQLAAKLLDIEAQRNDLKKRYYAKFKTALDAITAARFLQVENQIERIIDLQIASQLPVVTRTGK
jgi:hypothetical protein